MMFVEYVLCFIGIFLGILLVEYQRSHEFGCYDVWDWLAGVDVIDDEAVSATPCPESFVAAGGILFRF